MKALHDTNNKTAKIFGAMVGKPWVQIQRLSTDQMESIKVGDMSAVELVEEGYRVLAVKSTMEC